MNFFQVSTGFSFSFIKIILCDLAIEKNLAAHFEFIYNPVSVKGNLRFIIKAQREMVWNFGVSLNAGTDNNLGFRRFLFRVQIRTRIKWKCLVRIKGFIFSLFQSNLCKMLICEGRHGIGPNW